MIERIPDEGRETGIIRRLGNENEAACFPDLIAHRPEAWRFFRLATLLGAAKALTNERHAGSGRDLEAALASLEDCKGDFTAVWRTRDALEQFGRFVDRALESEGEDEILHRLDAR